MIAFELTDGKKTFLYRYAEKASELTIDKLIGYEQKIEKHKPEVLKELEKIEEEEERKAYLDSIDPEELEKAIVSYYMREIQYFTDMRLDHLRYLPVKDPEGIDIFGLRNLIRKAFIEAKKEVITFFKHKGVKYFLPPAPPNLFDPSKKDYMRGAKIGEYATAAELLRSYRLMERGSIEGLLNAIAVICRKKGEELPVYPDEQTEFIRERVEIFRDLDYQTAINVGFFLTRPELTSQNVLRYLQEVKAIRRAISRKNTVST